MSDRYAREILRRNAAQICQTIGWNGVQSTPLDILVHVLEKYVRTLGVQSARYAEQFNRTEPNLDDLALVFDDMHVRLPELADYARSVPPQPRPVAVDRFPHPKESNLNFLKPGSREVVTRPMYVHEHLPPMYPEKELMPPVAESIEIHQNGLEPTETGDTTCVSPEISVTDSPEKQKDPFKRPTDPISLPPSKRPRLKLEEEECHTREISSVMMTMSGFLSPAREGKLPEARTPTIISERHQEKHKANSHHSNLMRVPAMQASVEKSDKKSKKSRLVNGKIVKSKKRDKDRSHRSDSSKSKDHRVDKIPAGVPHPHRSKDIPILHHNNVPMPVPRPAAPVPVLDNIRPIKQEPLDHPTSPVNRHNLVSESAIPVPRKIPIAKSPLVPGAASTAVTKPIVPTNVLVPPPIEIKKEIIDEEEKLASQPDRSKINIFKRISNKPKEDKTPSELNDKQSTQSSTSGIDNFAPHMKVNKNNTSEVTKRKSHEHVNNNCEPSAVDLSKNMDLTTNEVINIDDDSMDINSLPRVKEEPIHTNVPVPNPVAMNKLKHSPYPKQGQHLKDFGVGLKVKKERKHKEKVDKSAERAAKINAKLLKKQQKLAQAMAAQVQGMKPQFLPSPVRQKAPKLGRPPKSESKIPQMPPGFPFFPSLGHGLMPGPGLIPNPLIPGSDLYAGLANNPALRGIHPPNLLANPFALGGRGLIPGSNFMQGPGLLPPCLLDSFKQPYRPQQPRFPAMRRPSLEVIPLDNDEDRKPHPLQILMKEKAKNDKHKLSSIPNILQKNCSPKRIPKNSPPKTNAYKMPTVTPDITIELNPPTVKSEPVKQQLPAPPSPVSEHVPVSVPVPVAVPKVKSPIPEPVPETSITEVPKEKDKDKLDKKKEKLHKKEKKEKDGLKIKKKKDKKDKSKDKSEKRKEKEEKIEIKDKIKKERKEKKKEKPPAVVDGLVPKLTLKLGSSSPMPPSSPDILKLTIKPVVKKDPEFTPVTPKEERTSRENSRSPELAQISALVTRPPKPKPSKHNHVSSEPTLEVKTEEPQSSNSSPSRKNRPPSSHSKYKRILIKPLAKRGHVDDESPIDSIPEEPPPRANVDKSTPMQLSTPFYLDDSGNKVWVCPACVKPDNGSPMIGCDGCDGWYHWVCVGITIDPGVSEDWFCKSCMAKRAAMVTALAGVQTGRKRGRKPKAEKVKDGH